MRDGDGSRRLDAAELGAELGERATLVQFSSAFCQPCRATRRTLTEVAAMVDGVAHVEIDAESRLELVRALDIARTPPCWCSTRPGGSCGGPPGSRAGPMSSPLWVMPYEPPRPGPT